MSLSDSYGIMYVDKYRYQEESDMKIEFLFSEIKDIEKLYQIDLIDNPFGGAECHSYTYIGKEYLQNKLKTIEGNLPGLNEFIYQQCFGRIANEVFVVVVNDIYYELIFTIDTYQYKKARMKVSIERPEKLDVAIFGNQVLADGEVYDNFLEQLKIAIKNAFKKDWAVCSWITDEQSEQLCSHLYPGIFKVENKIRAFANKILVHHIGKDWIKQYGMEKYEESHKSLSVDFKRKVPCFADIDDTFISMTMETMMEVILKANIYEDEIVLNQSDMAKLHQEIAVGAANPLLELMRNRRKVKTDIWNDIFKQYFEDEESAKSNIKDFIKNRNHVAHNKLLNWSGYQVMKQNIEQLDSIIEKANQSFEESIPSEEQYMTWNIGVEEEESEAARREWERDYLRLRISGETGVEIREEEGIYELFSETLGELYNEFSDIYYFDPQFDMSKKSDIAMAEEEQVLFSIRSNAVKTAVVEVVANMTFDSDMDGDSLLYISCRRDGTEIFRTVLEYHNGSGMEDTFEGKIVLNSESYYDTEELDEFKDELKDYIEEKLNPLISKKESLEYTAATSGGAEPVADIPCMECGKYGISISEDFYPLGRCCYCGEENYIKQCQRCGKWYEDGDGNDTVCAECLEKVMEE